jgi:hypothetical protein
MADGERAGGGRVGGGRVGGNPVVPAGRPAVAGRRTTRWSAVGVAGIGGPALRDRYGRTAGPRRRRALIVLAAGVAGLTVGWAAWVAGTRGDPEVRWQLLGFKVRSDAEVAVTFTVWFDSTVEPGADGVCTLEAQNELHSTVGLKDVQVGPASDGPVRVTATLPTSERATNGLVTACTLS